MPELNLPLKIKIRLQDFCEGLKKIYGDDLISVILYGSGASREFLHKVSNLNVLVVLASVVLEDLKKSGGLLKKFSVISPLYLNQDYILSSLDIFPIEFLDMRENYQVLYGKDVLKDIVVDTRNLRFQCEQELKVKLLGLRQAYLRAHKDAAALKGILLKAFTSVLHLARNVLRLRGEHPPYNKNELLARMAAEFPINGPAWERILAVKLGREKLSGRDSEALLDVFTRDLEKIVDIVDKM